MIGRRLGALAPFGRAKSMLQRDAFFHWDFLEEILRLATPSCGLWRKVKADTELGGVAIPEGAMLMVRFASANRDEAVFDDPFAFRIDRSPNRHLGFGIGEHYCLGSHLARLELEVAYKHLLPRIEEIELAGPIERLRSSLVGGVKHLPIRYKLRPAAA